jgi:hypothetical protein
MYYVTFLTRLFTQRRVYILMANLFQILNQFVMLFRKNVISKSFMNWRVLPLVKINTHILDTPCINFIKFRLVIKQKFWKTKKKNKFGTLLENI